MGVVGYSYGLGDGVCMCLHLGGGRSMSYARRRSADQMFRDGIRTAYRRGPVVKCAACHKQARFETPQGPRCFSHAIALSTAPAKGENQ